MNMISWALDFHTNWRNQYLDEDVVVHTVEGVFELRATKINPKGEVNAQGVRVNTAQVLFMFTASDITFAIRRGIRIVTNTGTYEVIQDRNVLDSYDDPENRTINIPAKLCI